MIDLTRPYHNLLQRTKRNTIHDFVDDPDQEISTFTCDFGVLNAHLPNATLHYHHDDLGSPIRITSDNWIKECVFGYDDFGNEMYNQPIKQPFTYTGYQKDDVTGTLFAQAREYMPRVGRFVSEDLVKGVIQAPFTQNHYVYCWNDPMNLVDLDGLTPTEPRQEHSNDERHIIFVHGTVLDHEERLAGGGPQQWSNGFVNHLTDALGVPSTNVHIPNWDGLNNASRRRTGGRIVAEQIVSILIDNPNAEILIIAYSHGGNVSNMALNNLFSRNMSIRRNNFRRNPCNAGTNCELDLSNITLVNTAAPAMYDYRLWESPQSQINAHFNFYNTRDATQQTFALHGSLSERMHVDGHPIGRAHHGAINREVSTTEVTWWDNRFWRGGAHSIMRTSTRIWDYYKVPRIQRATGW